MDAFYEEKENYADYFGDEPPSDVITSQDDSVKVGHFTQVVWKDTTEMGAGVAKASDGKEYFVVR